MTNDEGRRTDCATEIRRVLARMEPIQPSVQAFLQLEADCVNALALLPGECSPALAAVAWELLASDASHEWAESDFQILLQAIADREDPDAAKLTVEALLSYRMGDKESYVSMLFSLGDPNVDSMLRRRLADFPIANERDVAVFQQVVGQLRDDVSDAARRFGPAVRAHAASEHAAVRDAVTQFLSE